MYYYSGEQQSNADRCLKISADVSANRLAPVVGYWETIPRVNGHY